MVDARPNRPTCLIVYARLRLKVLSGSVDLGDPIGDNLVLGSGIDWTRASARGKNSLSRYA